MTSGAPPTGRFAPAPTGPLHFGSVVTALASWLDARSRGGRWLVRIEDLDTIRAVPGADEAILGLLRDLGLEWDGEVAWQSRRGHLYAPALARLAADGRCYPCACTRGAVGPGRPYPGTCRAGLAPGAVPRTLRVRTEPGLIHFEDAVQGAQSQNLGVEVGDYVVRRAEGHAAYHLAVVVDDAEQGVTEVLRGADLIASTPRQIHLHGLLGLRPPRYAHVPVVEDAQGRKLSKQNGAPAALPGAGTLARALRHLGHAAPEELARGKVTALLDWALAAWRLDRVPRRPAAQEPSEAESPA